METLTDVQIKKAGIELLKEISAVCEKAGVRFYLGYGSLLGAVRHNGFIPWDDDIDILIPRPDYERFEQYCLSNEVGFSLVSNASCGSRWCKLNSKAADTGTVVAERYQKSNSIGFGVSIDIFIVEGLGNSPKEAKRSFQKKRVGREILIVKNWERFFPGGKGLARDAVRLFFFLIGKFVNGQRLYDRICSYYSGISFEKSEYVGILASPYRMRDIFPKKIFEERALYRFEDGDYPSVADAGAYLRQIYGSDYMLPPPPEKRISNHDIVVYKKTAISSERVP